MQQPCLFALQTNHMIKKRRKSMIRGTTTVLLAALFLALVACSGGTRLDASSDEAMYESMTAIQEELPADQRAEFDEALQIVIASQVDFSERSEERRVGKETECR